MESSVGGGASEVAGMVGVDDPGGFGMAYDQGGGLGSGSMVLKVDKPVFGSFLDAKIDSKIIFLGNVRKHNQ